MKRGALASAGISLERHQVAAAVLPSLHLGIDDTGILTLAVDVVDLGREALVRQIRVLRATAGRHVSLRSVVYFQKRANTHENVVDVDGQDLEETLATGTANRVGCVDQPVRSARVPQSVERKLPDAPVWSVSVQAFVPSAKLLLARLSRMPLYGYCSEPRKTRCSSVCGRPANGDKRQLQTTLKGSSFK